MRKNLYCLFTVLIYFLLISCRSLPEYREDFSVLINKETKLLFSIQNTEKNKTLIHNLVEKKFDGSVKIKKILKRTRTLSFFLGPDNSDFVILLEGNYNRFYSGTYLTVSSSWKKESDKIEYWKNKSMGLNLYGFKDKAILLTNQDIYTVLNPPSPMMLPEDYSVLKENSIICYFPDFSLISTNDKLADINFPANSIWLLFNKDNESVYNLVIRGEFSTNKDARQSSSLVKMAVKKLEKEKLSGIIIDKRIKSEIDGERLYLEGFHLTDEALSGLISNFF